MAEETEVKSNRPPSDAFRQQKLKSWQPIMTPFKVVAIFVAIGVAFIPTGVTILNTSNDIYESTIMYDGSDQSVDCAIDEQDVGRPCTLTFTFTEDVDGPIYVYYELQNYYQNHRKYVNSRDADQLGGVEVDKTTLESTCISLVTDDSYILNPCGLIANSFFTDIFNLTTANITMDESSIAWPSDKEKFKQPDGFEYAEITDAATSCTDLNLNDACVGYNDTTTGKQYKYYYPNDDIYQYLYETYPDQISPIDGVTDQHFMVWMRTAALPTFRKLYGKISHDFKKGDNLEFIVTANYEVGSFSGSKSLVISQVGEFGGRNPYLGIAYIVVGSICLMFAFLFATKQLLAPRAVADPSLLNWN